MDFLALSPSVRVKCSPCHDLMNYIICLDLHFAPRYCCSWVNLAKYVRLNCATSPGSEDLGIETHCHGLIKAPTGFFDVFWRSASSKIHREH